MFRELLRKKQALTENECLELLKEQKRAVLAVQGDDGYPYCLPINHFYNDEDGHVYFHSGRFGHKVEAMSRCDKVSLCVYDEGVRDEGDWAYRVKSVVVFGRVRLVEDYGMAMEICRRLSRRFPCGEEYIEREVAHDGPATLVYELTPEHITGKRVHEA